MRRVTHLSFQSFPFVLAERSFGDIRFFEDSWKHGSRSLYLGAICLCIPVAGIVVANLMWPHTATPSQSSPTPSMLKEYVVLAGLCILVLLVMLFARLKRGTSVFLLTTPDDNLMLQQRKLGLASSASVPVPRAQCELRIHPVRIQYLVRPALYWHGYACVVHVGTDVFALAVTKDRESCVSVANTAPQWIPRLSKDDGDCIETVGNLTIG